MEQKITQKSKNADFCKLLAEKPETIDHIVNCLKTQFKVEPTSKKMFSDKDRLFFLFVKVSPKEDP
jgi:hypothetical protein